MNPLRPVALLLGAQPWLPKFAKLIVGLDRAIQGVSKGRLTLLMVAGLPELMLSVRGRKTGLNRTTPLLCVPHGGGWLVAGSNWGAQKPPAWIGNLAAAGVAQVRYEGRTTPVTARHVVGREREEVWEVMLRVWPNYAKYAERTDREIPVYWLMPA